MPPAEPPTETSVRVGEKIQVQNQMRLYGKELGRLGCVGSRPLTGLRSLGKIHVVFEPIHFSNVLIQQNRYLMISILSVLCDGYLRELGSNVPRFSTGTEGYSSPYPAFQPVILEFADRSSASVRVPCSNELG